MARCCFAHSAVGCADTVLRRYKVEVFETTATEPAYSVAFTIKATGEDGASLHVCRVSFARANRWCCLDAALMLPQAPCKYWTCGFSQPTLTAASRTSSPGVCLCLCVYLCVSVSASVSVCLWDVCEEKGRSGSLCSPRVCRA